MKTELEGQVARSERIRFSRTRLRFRWKTSSPAGPRSFFRQWLIAHMELPFALCVQRSPLWSVSKPRTVNQKARVLLCRNDQRARAWPEIPIRSRQVVPGPLEFDHSMNTRAESEGASLSSVYATDFLICFVLFFFFFSFFYYVILNRETKSWIIGRSLEISSRIINIIIGRRYSHRRSSFTQTWNSRTYFLFDILVRLL